VLSAACVLAIGGVYVEKGMGLLLPGMTPDVLGEVYGYGPSATEIFVGVGVWSVGALIFTLLTKVAMSVTLGNLRYQPAGEARRLSNVDLQRHRL
jgi:molybdopterin-containing oxidoreductase family membrane subunit